MRDLVQEIEEIEELDRLFPPLQVTTRGSAGQTASPQEATNDRVSTLRRELEALTLNENPGAEENPDTVSPPPYREVSLITPSQGETSYHDAHFYLVSTAYVRKRQSGAGTKLCRTFPP